MLKSIKDFILKILFVENEIGRFILFIRVVPYDPFWEVEYENESQKIKNILKDILVEVYHIGSTAVKGLAAKSIIDIMPVVTNISLVDKHNKEFVAIGYECMGEFGIEGRRYFRKGGDNRTHQIHIFEQSNHKDIKGIGCNSIHSMICTIHDKLNTRCNCTELAYNEFISKKFVVVLYIIIKFLRRFIIVAVISVFTNLNIWSFR